MTLVRPNFVTYSPTGVVLALDCKICGVQIANTVPRLGPVPGAVPRPKFSRNNLYAEIKMSIDDGSFHVTSGCKDCLNANMPPELLQEIFEADMEDQGWFKDAQAIEVVVVDYTAGGIV